MQPRDFIYWLQGFVELDGHPPDCHQWKVIQDHLKLVLDKQTPDYNGAKAWVNPGVIPHTAADKAQAIC